MGDNLRRYRAINDKLLQLFPNAVGRQKHYLLVLAALISGIVGSRYSHLPTIAAKILGQDKNKRESRVKQYTRWLQNERIGPQAYFAPFAREWLSALAATPFTLIIDGSQVGRGCMALVIAVVYKGWGLPIGWLVVRAKKGHLPQSLYIQLLK